MSWQWRLRAREAKSDLCVQQGRGRLLRHDNVRPESFKCPTGICAAAEVGMASFSAQCLLMHTINRKHRILSA